MEDEAKKKAIKDITEDSVTNYIYYENKILIENGST